MTMETLHMPILPPASIQPGGDEPVVLDQGTKARRPQPTYIWQDGLKDWPICHHLLAISWYPYDPDVGVLNPHGKAPILRLFRPNPAGKIHMLHSQNSPLLAVSVRPQWKYGSTLIIIGAAIMIYMKHHINKNNIDHYNDTNNKA